MKKTTNYGLTLYDKEDKMSITAEENSLNANMKIIDKTLKEKATINDMTDYIEEHKEELKGADGKDGYTPVKGVDYFDGKDGATGPQGEQGIQGIQGEIGPKGDTGSQGPSGKDGTNGKDGVSVTHSWNGTTLTVTSASGTSSANLKGDKGDKGDTGSQGPKGDTGATGPAGKDGSDASVTAESISNALGYMPANTKEIEDLMTYKEDYIITPNINGYVQVSDLYFKTNSEAKRTDYISVYGYHRIEFTTKISKSGYAVLFFDENRVAMPSVSVVGTNSKQVIDMAIPEGAMFVICCQYQYSSATGRLYRTSNNDTANALGQLKKSAYTFKGKKAMFFGDSITYDGNMYRNNLLDRTEMVGIYCFAQNGARLANYSDTVMDGVQVSGDSHNNTVPNQVQHLLNNLTTYTDVPDIIIVSAATNGGDSEEGLDEAQYTDSNDAYIDIDTVDIKTFSGAMRWIYEKLKELYPDAIICFATPIQSANGGSRTFAKLSRKAECIRQNCERLCTPCIDAFRKSGINARYEVASASGKYLKDGLHPNSAGAVVLAKCYHKELANALID